MRQKIMTVRVELDAATDLELSDWSLREQRSKRRHVACLLRKLAQLRKTRLDELQRLGLAEATPHVN